MMELKLTIADPKNGTSTQLSIPEGKPLHGLRIGDTFKGELIDKTGYEFRITGGSDNAGFPMRKDAEGTGRRKILIAGGVGYRKKRAGIRARRTVAGSNVGPQISSLNIVIEKQGKAPLIEVPAEEAAAEAEE